MPSYLYRQGDNERLLYTTDEVWSWKDEQVCFNFCVFATADANLPAQETFRNLLARNSTSVLLKQPFADDFQEKFRTAKMQSTEIWHDKKKTMHNATQQYHDSDIKMQKPRHI